MRPYPGAQERMQQLYQEVSRAADSSSAAASSSALPPVPINLSAIGSISAARDGLGAAAAAPSAAGGAPAGAGGVKHSASSECIAGMDMIGQLFQQQAKRLEAQLYQQLRDKKQIELVQAQLAQTATQMQRLQQQNAEQSKVIADNDTAVRTLYAQAREIETEHAICLQTCSRLMNDSKLLREALIQADPEKYKHLELHINEDDEPAQPQPLELPPIETLLPTPPAAAAAPATSLADVRPNGSGDHMDTALALLSTVASADSKTRDEASGSDSGSNWGSHGSGNGGSNRSTEATMDANGSNKGSVDSGSAAGSNGSDGADSGKGSDKDTDSHDGNGSDSGKGSDKDHNGSEGNGSDHGSDEQRLDGTAADGSGSDGGAGGEEGAAGEAAAPAAARKRAAPAEPAAERRIAPAVAGGGEADAAATGKRKR